MLLKGLGLLVNELLKRLYLRLFVRDLVLDICNLAISVHRLLLQLFLFLLRIRDALPKSVDLIIGSRKHRLLLRDGLFRLLTVYLESSSLRVKLVKTLLLRDD